MPHILTIKTPGRGFTDITPDIQESLAAMHVGDGVVHIFIQHTSASLIIQENADPDVKHDLMSFFDRTAPEGGLYLHNAEGPDDMPAHIKSALTNISLAVPVADGKLLLGSWQGILVFEHRRAPQLRRIVLTFTQEARPAV